MKIHKKILLILSMTIISISVANAQITDLDKKNFERRVRERVALMNDYISYMVDKKKGINTRKYDKTKALPLFIQKGEQNRSRFHLLFRSSILCNYFAHENRNYPFCSPAFVLEFYIEIILFQRSF